MTIKLIKDIYEQKTFYYLTQDDLFLFDTLTESEEEANVIFNNYIETNTKSNLIQVLKQLTINEPNESI